MKNNQLSKISIIVPVYNAEFFLDECLQSIINQSFQHLEVILVDDGSTDKSYEICKKHSDLDSRIKLFTQRNSGVSIARNRGLSFSSGEYILFVDSDDVLMPEAIELLYSVAIQNNSDITIGDYLIRTEKKDTYKLQPTIKDESKFLEEMLIGEFHAGLWNKLIKREILGSSRFNEDINYMEDKLLLTELLLKKPKLSYLKTAVYVYRQVNTSYSNNLSNLTIKNCYDATQKILSLGKTRFSQQLIMNIKLLNKYFLIMNGNSCQSELYEETRIQFFNKYNRLSFKKKLVLWLYDNNGGGIIHLYKKLKNK